jgi:hypothetical protein
VSIVRKHGEVVPGLNEGPAEEALGAPHRGDAQHDPQLRRRAEAPRVGGAVRVHDDDLGHCFQFGEGRRQDGHFTETQQARDAGEVHLHPDHRRVHDAEGVLCVAHHQRSPEGGTETVEGAVHAGHEARGRREGTLPPRGAQALLFGQGGTVSWILVLRRPHASPFHSETEHLGSHLSLTDPWR